MVSLQGPVICPAVRAKQAVVHTAPLRGPLMQTRISGSEFLGFKGFSGGKTKLGICTRHLNMRKHKVVQCTFSSSSNGSMAENFNENDEDYVNSSVIEAGMIAVPISFSKFCVKYK